MAYIDLFYKSLSLITIILLFYNDINIILEKFFKKFYVKQYNTKSFYYFFTFGSSIYSSFIKNIDIDFFIIFPFYCKFKTFFQKKKIKQYFFFKKNNFYRNLINLDVMMLYF
ncbi:hypothetical protein M951_chr292 (nucleomorph) [Lotharella oceanica]|uniref:Uncharacterized protein n=1 Tax=Lotharella oceanica TaxID=641309 RepID=A0A060DBD4_9EUKA|nr:hypothetical protein M951_chr292 [Lotharella oceanica]